MTAISMTSAGETARAALSLRPVMGAGRWDWSLAGEGFSRTGTVAARDREDAVVCALAAAHADLRLLGQVAVVVSLPAHARLWTLSEDLSACFAGVTITPFTSADAALRQAAMRALEPAPVAATRAELGPPLTVATDGSAAHRTIGWGWLAGDGQHGFGSTRPSRRCAARSLAVISELRGVSAAVHALPGRRLLIHTDSRAAITLVRSWLAGSDRLPSGYAANRHEVSTEGGLLRIRRQLRREAHRIDLEWIRGHAGDPLNEGADSLAKLARRHADGSWGLTDEEIPSRAPPSPQPSPPNYVST